MPTTNPYEQLVDLFGDIADAIRDHVGEQYQEEVVTNVNVLQPIITENTGYRGGYRVTQLLRNETYKCLMTDTIYKYSGSSGDAMLFIIDSSYGKVEEGNIGFSYVLEPDVQTVTITNNCSYAVTARGFTLSSTNQWNIVTEEPYELASGASKTYSSCQLSNYPLHFFTNTRLVPVPVGPISPQNFAAMISPTSAPSGNVTSLNILFTNIANAIRYEQGFVDVNPEDIKPGHILAPNGKYYGYYYYYKLTDTRYSTIRIDLKIWSDYRIAGTKNGTFQIRDPADNSFTNLGTGYKGAYEDENYNWTQEHDYFVYDGAWNNSAPMGPDYYEEYYSVETNVPLFDNQTDEQNFLKISLISPSDMPALIRAL